MPILSLLTLIISASLLLLVYLLLPFTAHVSMKWSLFLIGLFSGLACLTWLQMRYWIRPIWANAGSKGKKVWVAFSVLLGMLCFGLLTPPWTRVLDQFPVLAPQERLELRAVSESGQVLRINRIKIGGRPVPVSQITFEGDWQAEGSLLHTSDPKAGLVVDARVPRSVTIVFLRSPDAGWVEVLWAGNRETLDLRSDSKDEKVVFYDFERMESPFSVGLIRYLTLPAWMSIAFVACGVLFVSARLAR